MVKLGVNRIFVPHKQIGDWVRQDDRNRVTIWGGGAYMESEEPLSNLATAHTFMDLSPEKKLSTLRHFLLLLVNSKWSD